MIKVALTGNIASGKSVVQKIILEQGFVVLDTDDCAHELLASNKLVYKHFGTCDRSELAKIVFSDKKKLSLLEDILHPLIKDKIVNFFNENSNAKVVFVAVPQLFETGFDKLFDKIIFVSAPYDLRLKRLISRNGYDEKYARLRLNSQMDENLKIPKCDMVINNDSTFEELKNRTKECLELLL